MALNVMKGVAFTPKRLTEWLAEDDAVWLQPKRDEMRCTVIVHPGQGVDYISASGKPLYNLGKFDCMWKSIANITGICLFDTGVMVNDSFDLTKRTVRASKKVYDLADCTEHTILDKKVVVFSGRLKAKFWLYDLPSLDVTYTQRLTRMELIAHQFSGWVGSPETIKAYNAATVYDFMAKQLDKGLEGAMVKRIDHEYRTGRTTNWMKMKPEEEQDGEVIGFVEANEGKFEGLIGSIQVRFADGSTCAASGMSDAIRADISANRAEWLGRIVEIRYMHRDSKGGYRHPRFYRVHPDKTSLED